MSRPTRTRWKIGGLLCAAALVNYFLRVNISIAGDPIMRQFQLSQTQLGSVFSAFLLGYTLFQIPGGLLADRLGPRLVLAAAGLMWGALTVLTGLCEWLSVQLGIGALTALIALRFLLGISQAPMFPASGAAVARWFPARERAAGNALAITGISVGSCLAPPLVSWMVGNLTWQRSFLVASAASFLLAIVWMAVEDRPPAEIDRRPTKARASFRDPPLLRLTLSYALNGYVFYVFVFWFFLYLVQVRHVARAESAWLTTLPWILASFTTFGAGMLSDRLVRSRLGPTWGRRLVPMACQAGAALFLALGARAESHYVATAALAVCTGLIMGVEGPYWATASQLSGPNTGIGGGILNTGGNLGGILSPTLTPFIAAHFGWARALDVTAAVAVVAAVLWLWVTPSGQPVVTAIPLEERRKAS